MDRQREVSSILGALDDKIELNLEMNRTLYDMAQAIFRSWFVDFDPVVARSEGRRPFAMKDAVVALFPDELEGSELGLIPSGWIVLTLPYATYFREGPGILAKDFRDHGVPLVRLAGLKNSGSLLEGCNFLEPEKVEKKWSHFRLQARDLLLSSSATLGRVAEVGPDEVGAIPYTGIIRFREKPEVAIQKYIQHFLTSNMFQNQVEAAGVGSVLRHFGPSHLKLMKILIPPLAVQQQFSEQVVSLDEMQRQNQRESKTLAELRDLLLPKLLSGEIRVRQAEKAVEEVL